MKRAFVLFLIFSIAFSITKLFADKIPTKGIVCAEKGLNVRSGPRTSYNIISTLNNNTIVIIEAVVGKWYKIKTESFSGYVYSNFVTVTDIEETDEKIVLPHKKKVKVGRNMAKSASKATLSVTK